MGMGMGMGMGMRMYMCMWKSASSPCAADSPSTTWLREEGGVQETWQQQGAGDVLSSSCQGGMVGRVDFGPVLDESALPLYLLDVGGHPLGDRPQVNRLLTHNLAHIHV